MHHKYGAALSIPVQFEEKYVLEEDWKTVGCIITHES
jgi:hypothetical protein